MKSIRARLLALLLIGAIGVTASACSADGSGENSNADSSTNAAEQADNSAAGDDASAADSDGDSDDAESSDGGVATVAEGEMLKQDMTISDYVVEESQSNVPVNQGVGDSNADSSADSNGDTSSADSNGDNGNSGDNSGNSTDNGDSNSTGDNSTSESGNSGDSTGESGSGDSSGSTYTPDVRGKLLYWLDMSMEEDYVFNGDFVDVTFRVKDDAPDGNYTIGIGECDFANWDAETITYTSVDGDIAIGDAQQQETGTPGDNGTIKLICESSAAQQGEEVTVRFRMEDNPGVVGLIFRFTYDANVLEYVSYDVGADCADYIDLA